ncbi:hypothetical protein KC349_g2986 [Hortaea werneckii]|nr:hypothetical protein KC349_g2986 [Hortaea werneckii]
MLLRDLDTHYRFSKPTLAEQLAQSVTDKRATTKARELPCNEKFAMGLNELAAENGLGFFYFLPNRDVWGDKGGNDELHPEGRLPPQPGERFADLLYVPHRWSVNAVRRFRGSSQRFRYLACHALINPPASDERLHGIQLASHKKYPIYCTLNEAIVAIVTNDRLFCATTAQLASPVAVGRRASTKPLRGPDPELRMDTAYYIWDGSKGNEDKENRLANLRRYEVRDLYALYTKVRDICRDIAPSFDTQSLMRSLRIGSPDPGTQLGLSQRRAKHQRQDQSSKTGQFSDTTNADTNAGVGGQEQPHGGDGGVSPQVKRRKM